MLVVRDQGLQTLAAMIWSDIANITNIDCTPAMIWSDNFTAVTVCLIAHTHATLQCNDCTQYCTRNIAHNCTLTLAIAQNYSCGLALYFVRPLTSQCVLPESVRPHHLLLFEKRQAQHDVCSFAISKYSIHSWRQQRFAHIVTLLNKRAVICNVKFNVKQCVMKFVTMCSNV